MKNIFCILIVAVLFTSCGDFFEQTLEIEPPAHTDQMAISAFFAKTSTENLPLRVLVSRSTAILDNPDRNNSNLDDATVDLLSEGELLTNIPLRVGNSSAFNYELNDNPVIFQQGQSYTLRVNHPDYEEASSTVTVPQEVIPFRFDLEEDGGVDEFGDRVDRITVEFNDPVDQENFYEIAAYTRVTFPNQNTSTDNHFINSLDFNLQESFYGAKLLTDESFNGQTYKLLMDIDRYEDEQGVYETFLIWRSVTKDYYQFVRSVRQQNDSEENFGPFAEPVTIKANFTGGLGLFSINVENILPL